MATNTSPLKVICASCSAKFHVADELVRGRQVKFRCRKCQSPIEVDGTNLPERTETSLVSSLPTDPRPLSLYPSEPSSASPLAPRGVDTDAPVSFPAIEPSSVSEFAPVSEIPISDGSLIFADPSESAISSEVPTIEDRSAVVVPPSIPSALAERPFALTQTSNPSPKHMRRPSDPFSIRSATTDPLLAAPALATVERSNQRLAYSDAPTEIDVPRLPPPREGGVGRAILLFALLGAASFGIWVYAAPMQRDSAAPKSESGVAARMQAGDFQGVAAEPLKPGKAPAAHAEPLSSPAPVTSVLVPGAAPQAVAIPGAVIPGAAPQAAVIPGAAQQTAVIPGTPAPLAAARAQTRPTENPKADSTDDPEITALQKATDESVPGSQAQGAAPAVNAPSEPSSAETTEEFSTSAARAALEEAGRSAGECRTVDAPTGGARVAVTFAPSGRVTSAVIEAGPFAGTAAGGCVVGKFRSAHVPAFAGENVTVHKTVYF